MVHLQPHTHWKSDYTLVTMANSKGRPFKSWLKIAINQSEAGGILIDGSSPTGTPRHITGTTYVCMQIEVTSGVHRVWHVRNVTFDLCHMGMKYHEAFAQTASGTVYTDPIPGTEPSTMETTASTVVMETTSVIPTTWYIPSTLTTPTPTTLTMTTAAQPTTSLQTSDEWTTSPTETTTTTTTTVSTASSTPLESTNHKMSYESSPIITTPTSTSLDALMTSPGDVTSSEMVMTPSQSEAKVTECVCGCVVVSEWGAWGEWSDCSSTCGNGTRSRDRLCNHGNCPGSHHSHRMCQIDICHKG